MLKKFNINVDGRSYKVVVEEENDHVQTAVQTAIAPVALAAVAPVVGVVQR